jgi:hypothetical protein
MERDFGHAAYASAIVRAELPPHNRKLLTMRASDFCIVAHQHPC